MHAFHLDFFIDLHFGANNAFQLAFQCFFQFLCGNIGAFQNAYLLCVDEHCRAILSDTQKNNKQQHYDTDQVQCIPIQFSAAAFFHTFFLWFRLSFSAALSAVAFLASAASDGLAAAIGHAFFPFGKHGIGHGNSPYSTKIDRFLQILFYDRSVKIASKSEESLRNCNDAKEKASLGRLIFLDLIYFLRNAEWILSDI